MASCEWRMEIGWHSHPYSPLTIRYSRPCSARERVQHLGAEAFREALVVDAIGIRQLVLRHVEGAEQHVPNRKCPGEIHVAAAVGQCVMPAMEYRAGQHVFKRAQRPFQVGMHEAGMDGDE